MRCAAAHVLDLYAAGLDRYFGGVVQGLVTVPPSPPALAAAHPALGPEGWRIDVLPWVADLPRRFHARFGRSLAERLPFLLAPPHRGEENPAGRPDRLTHSCACAAWPRPTPSSPGARRPT